jgi:putative inorganic carbon (hco3(-)) transporter
MDDWQTGTTYQERLAEERLRSYLPLAAIGLLCAGVATVLLGWGEAWAYGIFIGIVLILMTFIKPEIALIAVTIMAPLEVYTERMGTLVYGTGLTPLNLLVILLIAGAWLQRFAVARPAAEATEVDTWVAAFLIISVLAVVHGAGRYGFDSQAVGQYLQMITAILLFTVGRRRWRSEKLAKVLVLVVCMLVLFESIQVSRQYFGTSRGAFAWKYKFIITGSVLYGNSNDTGAYLSQYGMIALGMFLGLRKSLWRWPALAIFVLAGAATFFTYSRAAYLALAAGVMLMLLFKHRRFLLPAVVIAFLLPSVLPGVIAERLATSGDDSAEQRKELWRRGIYLTLTNPIGVGWRGYGHDTGKDPHNMFVMVGAEQGPLGLLAFLMIFAASGRLLVKAIGRANTPFTQGLAIGLFGCFVAMIANNMFGSRLVWFYGGAHFFLLLGVLLVLTRPPPGSQLALEEDRERELVAAKPPSPWRHRNYL